MHGLIPAAMKEQNRWKWEWKMTEFANVITDKEGFMQSGGRTGEAGKGAYIIGIHIKRRKESRCEKSFLV